MPVLADRKHFFLQIDSDLTASHSPNMSVAVILVDIKNFRLINAQYGFDTGNSVLAIVASRLNMFANNLHHVFDLGGGVFGLIIPNLPDARFIQIVINKMLPSLQRAIQLKEEEVIPIEFYIGYACLPFERASGDQLLSRAENSLLNAKKRGQIYVIEEDSRLGDKGGDYKLHADMLDAIENNGFEFYYQPKVDAQSLKPVSAEALVRWPHPSHGMISPVLFIPMLERSGHIINFTKNAIHTALRQIHSWHRAEMTVSVNASAKNIQDDNLPHIIGSALSIWNVKPERLIIEVTESGVISDKRTGFKVLNAIRDLGVGVSIDDFGTGYSSLEYFKAIPATELKIDQVFVRNMLQNKEDRFLVEIIVEMGKKFGLKTVAEGVENQESLQLLQAMGCDVIQGFYFSKPLANDDFCDWLKLYQAELAKNNRVKG